MNYQKFKSIDKDNQLDMHADVKFSCPNCQKQIEQTVTVPEPNFGAEKMKDSGVDLDLHLGCEHCSYELMISGSHSYYELFLTCEEVDDDNFYFGQAEYEFDEYALEESIESEGIESILEKRKISSLFHFSKIENLEGISSSGIIPRSQLKESDFRYTDINRSDGFLNANCISVSFPQYRMFFIKRVQAPEQNWVIFEVSPEALLKKDSAFFERNAASRSVKKTIIDNRKTATAFEKMFDEISQLPSRTSRGIPDNYPTDPQAEILVFDSIEKDYIICAHFENKEMLKEHKGKLNGIKAKVSPSLFDNRVDHDFL
jgi:hypothetical protein